MTSVAAAGREDTAEAGDVAAACCGAPSPEDVPDILLSVGGEAPTPLGMVVLDPVVVRVGPAFAA